MLFVVLVTLFLVILSSLALAQQKINLNMGSTTSTSAIYAWCVATANAINKANVGINVTVIESGSLRFRSLDRYPFGDADVPRDRCL